jgi:hypothetical protein
VWDSGTINVSGASWTSQNIDLSNVSTLEVESSVTDEYLEEEAVYVGSDKIFSTGGNHGYTTRSLDVSSYSGEQVIKLDFSLPATDQRFPSSGTGNGVAIEFNYTTSANDPVTERAKWRNLVLK